MTDTAIQIENLTRDFGSTRAVDGLPLEVPAGITFGFLGPNGSGKTTTINMLLGRLSPFRVQAICGTGVGWFPVASWPPLPRNRQACPATSAGVC